MTDTVSIAEITARLQRVRAQALSESGGRPVGHETLDHRGAAALEQWRRTRPERLSEATWPTVAANSNVSSDVAQALSDWLEAPDGNVVIAGDVGAGKSHLAVAMTNELARTLHWLSDFVPAGRLFAELRNGERRPGSLGPVDPYVKAQVLVLDDVGSGRTQLTEYEEDALYLLINERWFRNAPTIVTTNLTFDGKDGLERFVGARIADRLYDASLKVIVAGKSLRGRPGTGAA